LAQERGSLVRTISTSMGNFVSEAVIGSLPKGLSEGERARIAASLPMSPALNSLSDLPKVSARAAQPGRSDPVLMEAQRWVGWALAPGAARARLARGSVRAPGASPRQRRAAPRRCRHASWLALPPDRAKPAGAAANIGPCWPRPRPPRAHPRACVRRS
jgi:hypothetical protein